MPRAAAAAEPAFPPGAVIRTLLKDYAPSELAGAATLFHEHMSFAPDFLKRFAQYGAETSAAAGLPPPAPANPNDIDLSFMQDPALMTEELTAAKREGVGCIVDGGHADMGRSVAFLQQLSMKSGVPIVAGTGFYAEPFYPKEIGTMSEEQVVRALVKQAPTSEQASKARDQLKRLTTAPAPAPKKR